MALQLSGNYSFNFTIRCVLHDTHIYSGLDFDFEAVCDSGTSPLSVVALWFFEFVE